MYSVYIPVMLRENFPMQETLDEIKRAECTKVFLSSARSFIDTPEGKRINPHKFEKELKTIIKEYESNGIECGYWIGESMGHGGESSEKFAYESFVSLGSESTCGFCCADEKFIEDVTEWAKMAARAGARIIIIDDDWRMHSHGLDFYAGCLCKSHVKKYCSIVGEDLTADDIKKKVYSGGKSKYRDAWMKMLRDDMLYLARKYREAVDTVNPECRMGLCLAPSVIGLDGADFMEICDALAGPNTKPFLRLIGAPYWAKTGEELANVVTIERMIAKWTESWQKKTGAEILFEGDVYPRPRFMTPAAYLEIADSVCRADSHFTGILKYMLDYAASPRYETGYIDKHVKDSALFHNIERMFSGKTITGIRPIEYYKLFRNQELFDDPLESNNYAYNCFRGFSTKYLTSTSVPLSFDEGVPAVFGENAKYVKEEDIKDGAILDATAADILAKRGIDVGVRMQGISDKKEAMYADNGSGLETHTKSGEITVNIGGKFALFSVDEKAEILGRFSDGRISAARYENKNGQKFAIYFIVSNPDPAEKSTLFRNYIRQEEMYENAEWISGKKLLAKITGSPDVYIITAYDDNEVAVGIWNMFPDAIDRPEVYLPYEPAGIEFTSCSGKLENNKVLLSELAPFGFAGFVYKRNKTERKEKDMAIVKLTKDNFEEEVVKSDKTVLIDFWAEWCGPCKMLSPIVDEVAEERDDIKVGKVNVDDEQELAMRFGIQGIPTLILMKGDEIIDKSVGYISKDDLLEFLGE